jgi:hypothetical protein
MAKKSPADKIHNQRSATVKKDRTTRKPSGNAASGGKIFGNWMPARKGGK